MEEFLFFRGTNRNHPSNIGIVPKKTIYFENYPIYLGKSWLIREIIPFYGLNSG